MARQTLRDVRIRFSPEALARWALGSRRRGGRRFVDRLAMHEPLRLKTNAAALRENGLDLPAVAPAHGVLFRTRSLTQSQPLVRCHGIRDLQNPLRDPMGRKPVSGTPEPRQDARRSRIDNLAPCNMTAGVLVLATSIPLSRAPPSNTATSFGASEGSSRREPAFRRVEVAADEQVVWDHWLAPELPDGAFLRQAFAGVIFNPARVAVAPVPGSGPRRLRLTLRAPRVLAGSSPLHFGRSSVAGRLGAGAGAGHVGRALPALGTGSAG